MMLKMTLKSYTRKTTTDLVFQICSFSKIILKNQIEFHYLKMIDDEIETDLECIKNHITLSDSKYQDIKIKTRIQKEFYCKKCLRF